jgi:hypothetical protein
VPIQRIRPEDKRQVWKPYKRVVLYLEDIDDILVPLRKLHGDVHVRNDDFAGTLLAADELTVDAHCNKVNEMKRLTLTGGSGDDQITVRLERPAKVEMSNPEDLALRSAYRDVQRVFENRATFLPRRFFAWFATASLVVWPWFGIDSVRQKPDISTADRLVSAGVIIVITGFFVFAGTWLYNYATGGICEIRLSRRADRWWPKNRDALTVNTVAGVLVGVIIGIPVGVLGSYLYSRLAP